MNVDQLRSAMIEAFHSAIAAVDLATLSHKFVQNTALASPVAMIAIGKAAPAMAQGAAAALGPELCDALIATIAQPSADDVLRIGRVRLGSHPLPNQDSVDAATACLQVASCTQAASLLVLVSGGASSIVCAPPESMPLADKIALHSALIRSGATIRDVNVVRRHLSQIKGGRLAAAFAGPVVCAIASDVIDGAPHDVGSGPACIDPTSVEDAARVIREHLGSEALRRLGPLLSEGLQPCTLAASRVQAQILVEPQDFAFSLADELSKAGLAARTERLGDLTAAGLARWMVERSHQLAAGQAVTGACEPTLRLHGPVGRGGRAGWVALRALIDPDLARDAVLLCGASDGLDGTSGAAGACVCATDRERAADSEFQHALAAHDDVSVHTRLGTMLAGGPTGINLTDVYAVARPG